MPSAISIHVIPSDQISVFWSYLDLLMTSGLIQKGVPITESANEYNSSVDTPKSASFIFPFKSINILPALTSLWIFLLLCRYSNPFKTLVNIKAT